MISKDQLAAIFPKCRDPGMWQRILPRAAAEFRIDSKPEFATWLAQIGHESAQLNVMTENLNYSGRGLMATWPKRFPTTEAAAPYARRPDRIANLVYADRLGNGEPGSGDGFRYRGRGLIQITGKDNYLACGKGIGLPLVMFPQKLEDPIQAARSAAWFWDQSRAEQYAALPDDKEIFPVTQKINGGKNGIEERMAFWTKAKEVLGVA